MSILVEVKKKRGIDIVAHLLTKSVYANWSYAYDVFLFLFTFDEILYYL